MIRKVKLLRSFYGCSLVRFEVGWFIDKVSPFVS